MMKSKQSNDQAGMSLLSVMIAIVILGLSAAAGGAGFRNLYIARRTAAASAAALDVQDALVQTMAQAFRSYVQAQCDPAVLPDIASLAIGSLATMSQTPTIILPAGTGGSSVSDVGRCATTPFSSSAPPAIGSFYDCYQIAVSPTAAARADRASFSANQGSFIEALAHIRDLRTDQITSCPSISSPAPGYGLEIYYSLHWVINSNTGPLYKTKVGSINVAL